MKTLVLDGRSLSLDDLAAVVRGEDFRVELSADARAGVDASRELVDTHVARGDVVTHLDGQPVDSARTFFERLEVLTDEQRIELTLQREGNVRKVALRVEEVPPEVVDEKVAQLLGIRRSQVRKLEAQVLASLERALKKKRLLE